MQISPSASKKKIWKINSDARFSCIKIYFLKYLRRLIFVSFFILAALKSESKHNKSSMHLIKERKKIKI